MKKALIWLDNNFELVICSVFLCSLAFFMMLQVFCRYVMNNALSWPEELSCYLHIWYAMLGISYATKNGLHLRVDTVINLFPKPVRSFFNLLADVMLMIFFVFMVKVGIGVTASLIRDHQLSSALRIPMWIIYCSLAVGCALALFRLLQKWYFTIKKMKTGKEEKN